MTGIAAPTRSISESARQNGPIEIYLAAYLPDAALPYQGALTLVIVILVLRHPQDGGNRCLRKYDVRSTFFVIGEKLRDRRHVSEMAQADGHWIGNHTYTHLVPLGQSREDGVAVREIERADSLLGDLAHPRLFFRPFGNGGDLSSGLLNKEALRYLQSSGHTCVLWNAVPEDWVYPTGWVERALDLCFAHEHSVLVLHDLPTGAMSYLDEFLARAGDRGANFTQEFPRDCVLIESGVIVQDVQPYLSG